MIPVLSFALLAAWATAAVLGLRMLLRQRAAGAAVFVFACVAVAAQAAASLIPVGIGEPLIRLSILQFVLAATGALMAGSLVGIRMRVPGDRIVIVAAVLGVPMAVGALWMLSVASTPPRERERDAVLRPIALPPGFRLNIYADAASVPAVEGAFDNPTVMTFGEDGIFVADIAGNIWRGADADGDGRVDALHKYADGFQLLVGLAWRDGELYVSSAGKIEALRDSNGDGRADARRILVKNLPTMVLQPHSNNSLTFGPDGRLYFGVGSTVAGGPEPQPLAGAILSANPDGGDVRVEARGFGNPFEIAFNTAGAMFAGDNQAGEVNDEFNYIVPGGDYGPGGDRAPIAAFPVHSTPTGLTFYDGVMFPRAYRGTMFAALWMRGEVVNLELTAGRDGAYSARPNVFASGFLYPVDVVAGPDGALYIADFGTSTVYRVRYGA
ncbi:MAG: PQQ-dependent sugar dehydrogenase [Chloroflexi bacterium]|nr:PQQ-dependent sugar dehydrogenase [Chloroflexota bacterium]